jgi:hypothetical protein
LTCDFVAVSEPSGAAVRVNQQAGLPSGATTCHLPANPGAG